jgi:hypothetical protein
LAEAARHAKHRERSALPAVETTPVCPLPRGSGWSRTTFGRRSSRSSCASYPRARTGRPPADLRRVLDGIIHRLRSGWPVEVSARALRCELDHPRLVTTRLSMDPEDSQWAYEARIDELLASLYAFSNRPKAGTRRARSSMPDRNFVRSLRTLCGGAGCTGPNRAA